MENCFSISTGLSLIIYAIGLTVLMTLITIVATVATMITGRRQGYDVVVFMAKYGVWAVLALVIAGVLSEMM